MTNEEYLMIFLIFLLSIASHFQQFRPTVCRESNMFLEINKYICLSNYPFSLRDSVWENNIKMEI